MDSFSDSRTYTQTGTMGFWLCEGISSPFVTDDFGFLLIVDVNVYSLI